MFPISFTLRSSSLRCDGFDFRAEVRMTHYSINLPHHNLSSLQCESFSMSHK
ncbi:hypothetical protein PO909_027872 [Leuciscus waleckii]